MSSRLIRAPALRTDRLVGVGPRRSDLGACAAAALLLHAALILSFFAHTSPRGPETPATIEVELVDQAAQRKGSGTPPSGRQAARSHPAATPGAGLTPPALPPTLPSQPASQPLPAVRLADGDEDRESLKVSGDVVPARPDARFHNAPPSYPPEAVREGAQGDVLLLIHVTAAGVPASVEVRGSSGRPSLDQAAKDAVALWRFLPARNAGHPVPFDFVLNTRFRLGETP